MFLSQINKVTLIFGCDKFVNILSAAAAAEATAEAAAALPASDIPWGPLNIDRAA